MNAQRMIIIPISNVHPEPGISIIFISSLTPTILIPLNKIHIPNNIGSIVAEIAILKMRIKPRSISTIPLMKIHIFPVIIWWEFVAKARLEIPEVKMTIPIIDERNK